jgi:hypothetical protein
MNLDFLLTDEAINWANEIITAHPSCQVIVSTHIYMSQTGSFYKLDGSSGIRTKYYVENNGEGLWDKLISRHSNIVMLLCGHNPTDDIFYRQRKGVNGNTVTEILIDPQTTDKNYGGTGLVAMFYFSEEGKHLDVQYYSTAKDAFFKENNQFSLELDVSGVAEKDPEPVGDTNDGDSDKGGFLQMIMDFFAKIVDWIKSVFELLTVPKEAQGDLEAYAYRKSLSVAA